ncbi:MAG: hypothetical protein HY747_10470 [Elusimicrobia bacterium]|nr:hypothetical protein [Elusimicrobiota bacterium]
MCHKDHRLYQDGHNAHGRPIFSGLYAAVIEMPAKRKITKMAAIRWSVAK